MAISRVSSKGWVVIPAAIRARLKIRAGDAVEFVEYGGVLHLVPLPPDPARALKGMIRTETSLPETLLGDRRPERDREEESVG